MTREAAALEALADALAAKARKRVAQPATRPQRKGQYRWDSVTREHCLRRIRTLRNSYRLHWLVDQHTFNIGDLDQLDDNELDALLRDVEKARECSDENIPFEDAGLVRNVAGRLPTEEDDYQS